MTRVVARVDIAFKKIFGVEENKDLLISLVNSIVSEEDQVVDLELLNPYNQKSFKKDKLSILDIKAKDKRGQLYNIEMQLSDEDDYDKRALYYWARVYAAQLEQAMNYSKLRKTIGIHILNFISIPNEEKYHSTFYLTEKETGYRFFKDMELHTIELRKFEKSGNNIENGGDVNELSTYLSKIKTALDRWVTFLTKHDLLDANNLPKELADPAIKKALQTLDIMNFTQEEKQEYEEHLKWLRMEDSAVKKVEKKGFAKGKEEGIIEGEAKGKSEGMIEVAKRMLSKNKSVDEIIEFTSLTATEIEDLAESFHNTSSSNNDNSTKS